MTLTAPAAPAQAARAYIVTAHPDPDSLTVGIVRRIGDAIRAGGGSAIAANVLSTGFDTVFGDDDLAIYRRFISDHVIDAPGDVATDQAILERSTALVLVFPVHWWGMPAPLKGWVERLLTGGWAWGVKRIGRSDSSVSHLTAHVVAVTGADQETFVQGGYDAAMRVQIERGIFEYCGFGASTWSWVWNAEQAPAAAVAAAVDAAVLRIAPTVTSGTVPR